MRQDKNGMSLPWYPISRISSRPAGTIMGHVRSKRTGEKGEQVSRRRIGRIMRQKGLVSDYTTAQFRPQKDPRKVLTIQIAV